MRTKLALGLVLLAAALALTAVRLGGLQGAPGTGRQAPRPAPELTGISGWINGDPTSLQDLRGRVVLLDFWTYSCINCIRTFPFLRALHDRYQPAGLTLIGVHSPEFAFERDPANVRAAVARHDLDYPIALDDDMATWRAYRNRFWPRVYLIDAEGRIRFDHIGEGGEDSIEREIRALLAEREAVLPPPVGRRERGPSPHITPEVYAGYERGGPQGALGNPGGYRPGDIERYEPPDRATIENAGTQGTFFLAGAWRAEREYLEAAEDGARLLLRFRARDVYLVAAPAGSGVTVRVLLDDAPVDAARAGASVTDGVLKVDRSDLFAVLRLPAPETGTIELVAQQGFRIYTFTFG